jgi:hypothetical protein
VTGQKRGTRQGKRPGNDRRNIWITATYRIPFIVPHELKADGVVEINGDLPKRLTLAETKTPSSNSETGSEVDRRRRRGR